MCCDNGHGGAVTMVVVVQMSSRRSHIQVVRMVAATANPEPIDEPLCRRSLRRPNVEAESAILRVSPASGLQAKTGRQPRDRREVLNVQLNPGIGSRPSLSIKKLACSHLCQTHLQ